LLLNSRSGEKEPKMSLTSSCMTKSRLGHENSEI
jgi:hypothetical protein